MLFNSLDYMLFLVVVVGVYWALLRLNLLRTAFVVGASCLFYMAWRPAYILLLLFASTLDFAVAHRIAGAGSPRARKAWLMVSLTGNLGLLGTFKYFNFFSSAVTDGLGLLGLHVAAPYLDVILPVGISFFTFQTMSYAIDVYRGTLAPEKSYLKFLFFTTFFPQLVAGPIVRAVEFLPQLGKRPALTPEAAGRALFLIALGLLKKVAVADYLSVNLVDRVFEQPELYSGSEVAIAMYAFTMQIYCDFSGYTDVARGSAKLMGFELPENFDRPYMATSPADYWRRWHQTLSRWLRDYLYFPLGGSRSGGLRAYFNLWVTMFLIGIWHGAGWTFVCYGLLQATAMVLHRFWAKRFPAAGEDTLGKRAFKIALCLQFVVFSRILFRASSLDNAGEVAMRLVSGTTSVAQISSGLWMVLGLAWAAHYVPKGYVEKIARSFEALPAPLQGVALACVAAGLSLMATSQVVPYIYFQF